MLIWWRITNQFLSIQRSEDYWEADFLICKSCMFVSVANKSAIHIMRLVKTAMQLKRTATLQKWRIVLQIDLQIRLSCWFTSGCFSCHTFKYRQFKSQWIAHIFCLKIYFLILKQPNSSPVLEPRQKPWLNMYPNLFCWGCFTFIWRKQRIYCGVDTHGRNYG